MPPPDGFQEPSPGNLRGRLPLLVQLREFWRTIDCGDGRQVWYRAELEQSLAQWVDRIKPDALNGTLFKEHLTAGSVFLLLDGLDEVPISEHRPGITLYPRALLLSGLADALPTWERLGNRTLLTSRPYGLDESGLARLGLLRASLEPLPKVLQRLFITRWFHTLNKPLLGDDLSRTLHDRDDLSPLAENPMLLTAICVIYGNGGRLPEDRYKLYQDIVNKVLFNRYPGDTREREPVKARLEAIAYGMHTGEEPGEVRRTPAAEVTAPQLENLLRTFAKLNPVYEGGRVEPAVRREDLLTRSGLLLPRPGERVAFYHLSIQEYLAAERIARTNTDATALEQVMRAHWSVPEWRPTLLFLFAGQVFRYRNAQWGLDLLSRLTADLDRRAVKDNPAPAVFVAEALDLCLAKGYIVPEGLAEALRCIGLAAIDDEIAIPARQTLGLCLGQLGDPRIRSLREPDAYIEVPAGTYLYGETGETNERIRIARPFLLARYPATNEQYRMFVADDGYANRHWWSGEGWAWLEQEHCTQPLYWGDRRWNGPNQPVVGVSFWEAEAFCHWAGGRLPSEHEWEAASGGPEGREYPWLGPWVDGICNSRQAGLGVTSPVGLFPSSREAILGLEDLAGNCWEWCEIFGKQPQPLRSARVKRGGAFINTVRGVRVADRYVGRPAARDTFIGFRCLLAAF